MPFRESGVAGRTAAVTTASLRWRARVTRDATLAVPSGDTSDPKVSEKANGARRPSSSPLAMLWTGIALGAIASSFYNLKHLHTWFTTVASTLSVSVACWTLLQRSTFRRLGNVRQVHSDLRTRVSSLGILSERLYRYLENLDSQVDRLRHVQTQLSKYVASGEASVATLSQLTSDYRKVQEKIQRCLVQRVQEQILRAVLQTDTNANWELSGPEKERLIIQLRAITAIRENQLREILVDASSLGAVVQLLQQAVQDSKHPDHARVFEFHENPALQPHKPDLLSM